MRYSLGQVHFRNHLVFLKILVFLFAFSRVTLSIGSMLPSQHIHILVHTLTLFAVSIIGWALAMFTDFFVESHLQRAAWNMVFVSLFLSFVDMMMAIHLGYYFITVYLYFVFCFVHRRTKAHTIILRHFLFDCILSVAWLLVFVTVIVSNFFGKCLLWYCVL